MVSKIKAVGAYRPRIKLGKTASLQQLVSYITGRTGLNEGEITSVTAYLTLDTG
jgi:hypothetical protein